MNFQNGNFADRSCDQLLHADPYIFAADITESCNSKLQNLQLQMAPYLWFTKTWGALPESLFHVDGDDSMPGAMSSPQIV